MRNFAVFKIGCKKCGEPLELHYAEKNVGYALGEPTGAAMVELPILASPCGKCFGKYEELKTAISLLVGTVAP